MREDFKKQLRGGAKPPRLIPGMQVGDPKRRILILFGLLVLLVFMASMLSGYSNRPETQEITTEAPPSKEIPGSRADHQYMRLDLRSSWVIWLRQASFVRRPILFLPYSRRTSP